MLKTTLTNPHGNALWSRQYFEDESAVNLGGYALVTIPVNSIHGTFKSVSRTGAGTSTITSPDADGSLLITDLLISGEKQVSSTVEVRFTDGSQSVTLFLMGQAVVPATVAHSFTGRFQGWKNARIEMITVGTADATVTLGYTKIPTGLVFAEWDTLR